MKKITALFLLALAPLATAQTAVPALLEVQVPFGCNHTFPVSQSHNVGSHLQNDTWAWDFRMPVGTPIVAAADGQVRMARGDSTVGGCDAKFAKFANYVVVAHANGLETQYLHFSQVVVKPGDTVKAGDLLGYSGETGWACGAHLHFKVAQARYNGWNNPSVPARIFGYGDPTVETLISAPVCRGPEVMIAKGEAQHPAETAGALASNDATNAAVVPAVVVAGAENAPSGVVPVADVVHPTNADAPSAAGGSGAKLRR